MVKETIKYTDWNGTEREETFRFNLTESELAEWELSQEGGLKDYLERMIKAQDRPAIIKMFKDIILKSYGELSPDGRNFVKSPEISAAFTQTKAYDQIFMSLIQNEEKMATFIREVCPKEYKSTGGLEIVKNNEQ